MPLCWPEATYDFVGEEKLAGHWAGDTEQSIAFTFSQTKSLVTHSITLTEVTYWLKGFPFHLIAPHLESSRANRKVNICLMIEMVNITGIIYN